MAECIVLCLGCLSYVRDISLMYWVFVLCVSLTYGILVLCFEQKSKSHVARVQLWRSVLSCLGYSSYVWGTSLVFEIFVL